MLHRKPAHTAAQGAVSLPMARHVVFTAGILRSCLRLLVWLDVAMRFLLGNAVDAMLGRGSIERRAVRLREAFERAGGTFGKLGQQLSLRADLLPYAYCVELSKMLDSVPPFPTAQAIAIIEQGLGRSMSEIFESFDPEPIGSASLSCVYQARLRSGELVAVKVRRPGIGQLLAADLRILDWMLILGEGLTLIRPGMTGQFRRKLRKMLMGELNFRAEARHNEMFRLRAEKDNDGTTAPRVFFQYCTDEILVNELVSGVWMWEVIAAADRNDETVLEELRAQGIEPRLVAHRLILTMYRELLEHLFFHADPHPANLVVLPDSRICFIDFGAVGRFSTETRNTWRELQYHLRHKDIERMVDSSLRMAGRLPPVDIDAAREELEEIYADWVYAISSADAEWWERSTAQGWLRYINVARRYGIPVTSETLQFFRATFLYDSMIARLDKDIDPLREWRLYARRAGKDARRRAHRFLRQRLNGPTNTDYLHIEQFADAATQFVFRFRQSVEDPIIRFRNAVGKIAYGFSMLLRLAYSAITVAGLVLVSEFVAQEWFGQAISWQDIWGTIASNHWLWFVTFVAVSIVIRRIVIRMDQPERNAD